MATSLAHRGPDDEGFYSDPEGRISLGARRLSIIDVAGGAQPLSNEDGTVWAILNGEIYNFQQLRAQLQSRGHVFRSSTDTEVLVHLYEDYGRDLVHAIDGMFALAIWDETVGRLLLARDRFGEKPLFVEPSSDGLAFASELSALVRRNDRPLPALDAEAVDSFFIFGYVPGPLSIIEGIKQLPPGHSLEWLARDGSIAERSYWRTTSSAAGGPHDALDELKAETLRLLRESVRRTLTADVPVGVFLSGGLDSALLTAIACAQTVGRVQTFSVGYDVGTVSELSAARRTAEILGTDHHEMLLTENDVATRIPRVFANLDQPLADPALIPLHAVAGLAREHVTVAVGGEGADELFGGYPRYRWLARSAAIRKVLPAPGRTGATRAVGTLPVRSRARRLADLLGSELTLDRHVDWVTADRRHIRPRLYGERLSAFVDDDRALETMRSLLPSESGPIGAHGFMSLDQRSWLPDDVLAKADRAGMLNSLEVRTPYLSRDLAEFANSVSADVHLGWSGKQLLRGVLKDVAPLMGTDRPKTAFRVPGGEWLRGPLNEPLRQQIEEGSLVREGWYDRAALRATFESHSQGRSDEMSNLWPVLSLSLWYEGFRAGGA